MSQRFHAQSCNEHLMKIINIQILFIYASQVSQPFHLFCIILTLQFTYSDILTHIQASETEIMAGLKKLQACQINGMFEIIDDECNYAIIHV